MDYCINFDSATSPATVKDAVVEQWGLHPAAVFAGAGAELERYDGPDLEVVVQSGLASGSRFGTEMQAGIEFALRCDFAGELSIAIELCLVVGTRAVISAGAKATHCLLITEDGWHGPAVLDADALARGAIVLDAALGPVRAPRLPFGDWERLDLPPLGFAPIRRGWDW